MHLNSKKTCCLASITGQRLRQVLCLRHPLRTGRLSKHQLVFHSSRKKNRRKGWSRSAKWPRGKELKVLTRHPWSRSTNSLSTWALSRMKRPWWPSAAAHSFSSKRNELRWTTPSVLTLGKSCRKRRKTAASATLSNANSKEMTKR